MQIGRCDQKSHFVRPQALGAIDWAAAGVIGLFLLAQPLLHGEIAMRTPEHVYGAQQGE